MSVLFYDTETTGLPLWGEPSDHPDQPHLVELAAVLTDDDLNIVSQMSVLVEPNGWDIPPEVTALHGIDAALAGRYGVTERTAIDTFTALWSMSTLRVGHNENFDARIMRIAFKRHGLDHVAEDFRAGAKFCTFNKARSLLAGDQPKPDSFALTECVKFFCGKDFIDAHRALPDAMACRLVYEAIKERGGA